MKKFIMMFVALSALGAMAGTIDVSEKLKQEIAGNNKKVVELFKKRFQYTLELKWDEAKCLAQESPIGEVGTCLVEGVAMEEAIAITVAVNKTSHYSGTGETEGELSVTLINYRL